MKWLKDRLDELGKRPIELARHLDIPSPRVYELLSGKRRFQTKEIAPAAKFLEWPDTTLLAHIHGTAIPRLIQPPPNLQPSLVEERTPRPMLEVWASAEDGQEGAMVITSTPIDYIPRPTTLPLKGSFAVYLLGDSMSPAYDHGDQLYVNTNKPVSGGVDCLFVRELDGGTLLALVKRLVRPSAEKWHVRQFNPPRELDLDRRDWPKAWPIVGKMNRP